MSSSPPTLDPRSALECFLPGAPARITGLGSRGGFSGAEIYRVEIDSDLLCLKAWPERDIDADRLERMHALISQARRAGLSFVPDVRNQVDGSTTAFAGGRYWDLTTWMPGAADFHRQPSPVRLAATLRALGQVHAVWQSNKQVPGPCPSIGRRLQALADWNKLLSSGCRLAPADIPSDAWRALLSDANLLVRTHTPRLEAMLMAWYRKPVRLQSCIGDVWHDHILFQGDLVSGLIDFGGARTDHPSADLGRLVGSLVADDDNAWTIALAAYRAISPLSWEEESLARLLDRTGVIVGLMNWLRWCGRGEREFVDPEAALRRLSELVERVRCWEAGGLITGI